MLRCNLLAGLAVAALAIPASAQDGPLRRTGRALDNAGKTVRARVENEVVKGEIRAEERELLARVQGRLRWDRQLVDSLLQIEVLPDGSVTLRGSVPDQKAKDRAVDLAESTAGVTRVVDELGVGTRTRVIEVAKPGRVVTAPAETKVVVPPGTRVVVPGESKVIVPKR